MRLAFATCGFHPQLSADDGPAIAALAARGHSVEAVPWRTPDAAWSAFDAVLPRSTWDYHLYFAEFTAWLGALQAGGCKVFNPAPVLRWNADKRYLLELEARGAAVVPTTLFAAGQGEALRARLREPGLSRAVVKPAVSLGAHHTWLVEGGALPEEALLAAASQDLLVQPFVEEIVTEGEWSLLFFDGVFSHAALKRAKAGDFRVQEIHGGTSVAADPPGQALSAAEQVLALAPKPDGRPLVYARVDGVVRGGRFELVELELIEPFLFFGTCPPAAERFAAALAARL